MSIRYDNNLEDVICWYCSHNPENENETNVAIERYFNGTMHSMVVDWYKRLKREEFSKLSLEQQEYWKFKAEEVILNHV